MLLCIFAGQGARFNCDALKQRAHRFKQRKTGTRLRLCFNGLDKLCCIEAMSDMVKTVEDYVAAKTMPQWTANITKA
jgi:hypothetical protein